MGKGKTIKRVLIITVVLILGVAGIVAIGVQIMLQGFSKEMSKVVIENVNLSRVEDGIYTGEYYPNETVGARVKVTIEDNKIVMVEFLEHKYGKGKKAEAITEEVIDKQSLDVDSISGATGSSKVILKAIEEALKKGISK